MNIILFGPPGGGKGTIAEALEKRFGLVHISSGEILRESIQKGTPLGEQAKVYMNAGKLVPDNIINGIMLKRLKEPDCRKGYILEGYPRNLQQAEFLSTKQHVDQVVKLVVKDEEIMHRLNNRRTCKVCGHTTSVQKLVNGRCEECGGEVYKRDDDHKDAILERLKIYEELTQPMLDFYRPQGIVWELDGSGTAEQNIKAASAVIENKKGTK